MDESGPGEIPDLLSDFLPEALNSPSPRFAFFTVLVVGKGFINSFFRLLDFASNTPAEPFGN